jgi:hypothetical protein
MENGEWRTGESDYRVAPEPLRRLSGKAQAKSVFVQRRLSDCGGCVEPSQGWEEGDRGAEGGYGGDGRSGAVEQGTEAGFRDQAGQAQPPDRARPADSRDTQPAVRT